MNKILFEELKVNPKDLSCMVAFDNFHHWNITFWRREAYSAFWTQYAAVADKEELQGLRFETGQKYRERGLYIKMYSDELEHEDMRRWLEGRVEKILDIQRVLDQWQIWTGAWKARVVLEEDLRYPGRVRHLPSLVSIGTNSGHVTYHGQPKLRSRCGVEGHIAAFCRLMVCYKCGSMGHRAKACKEKVECTLCGGEGHLQRQCPMSYASKARESHVTGERSRETPGDEETIILDTDSRIVEKTPEVERRNDVIEQPANSLCQKKSSIWKRSRVRERVKRHKYLSQQTWTWNWLGIRGKRLLR
ncbi:zinc finger CCHC domain-containing protein 3 [Alligator mississippiensis]|uniref:Zinc finger CCHC domain-containing protein 3 n=1 Tax=Alligator mississippiensis TaxID=8496 RepID=A0A151N915_ALLMI|nr:zinc finger CCHC domain-containing protein 3 [Alligator mississippiensis]